MFLKRIRKSSYLFIPNHIFWILAVLWKTFWIKKNKYMHSLSNSYLSDLSKDYGQIVNVIRALSRVFKDLNPKDFYPLIEPTLSTKSIKNNIFGIIEITNNCSFNCKGCYVKNKTDKYNMPEELLRKSIKKLSSSFLVLIQGGEPLNDETIRYLPRILKEFPNYVFVIVTNGQFISTSNTQILEELFNIPNILYAVSINGNIETNEKTRKGTYNYAINTMQILRNERKYFTPIVTLSNDNLEDATSEKFIKLLANAGAKDIKYLRLKSKNVKLALSLEKYENAELLTRKYNKYLMTSFNKDEDYEGLKIINPYGVLRENRTGYDYD